ncbi:MAG TPA: DUF5654 family protein [Methanocorpusculum sp.]|nr:DUF5654 family protein [Methanocorpusculum sp.]HJJ95603.1 DUF5654 family protein [Methanocorpusculum sp.]
MSFSIDVIEKLSSLITAAFGLVAALAWNDTIKAIFVFFLGEQGTIPAMISYAVFVTIIAVLAAIWLGSLAAKAKKAAAKLDSKVAEKLHKVNTKEE